MNNEQPTAMKLYTEEQVKEMFEQFQTHLPFHYEILLQEHMNKLTPIELPSDDEIREVIKPFQNEMDDFDLGFRNGVQWLREKIKGGEQ
jgi:hypothetical protein